MTEKLLLRLLPTTTLSAALAHNRPQPSDSRALAKRIALSPPCFAS